MAEGRPICAQVRGLTLRGLAWGAPGGRPVVAVHGWLDNAHSFRPLAAAVPERHWLAVEMPGHGRSAHHGADADYHFLDYLKDLLGWLEALQLPACHLVGHSMGACVAALFAATFPQKVHDLALIDALGPPTAADESLPQQLRCHIRDVGRLARRQPRIHASQAAYAQQLARVVPGLPPWAADELAARALIRADCPQQPQAVQQGTDLRLRATSMLRLTERQLQAMLAQIDAPTLLIRAAQGMPFDEAQLAARSACVRRLTSVTMAGGHHVHMERAAAVAAQLRAFWSAYAPLGADA